MMKNRIIALAKKNKISDVGFCSMEKYRDRAEYGKKGVFLNDTPLSFDAKTAIVFAFSYYIDHVPGNISRYAWGKDYHIVAMEKMSSVVKLLEDEGYMAESFSDIGSLDERLLAKLSGIAFIGRNSMAISRTLGSYFFIGYILTDCELEQDNENTMSCMECGKCVEVCPLGALSGETFNQEKCVSYISQKKGDLSRDEADALKKTNMVWGCDLCQEICPHNKNIQETEIDEFKNDLIIELHLEDMSNKEFKEKYGQRAFAWRGKSVIQRNQNCIYNMKRKNFEKN